MQSSADMEASSTVVIKVKYGEILRRFNAQIVDKELDLSMDGLREKIYSLFSFSPDTDLLLTYIDEDGDVVTLADDDDLHDVVQQALNPLRITIKLNDGKNSRQFNRSSGSSTPVRSPQVHQPSHNPKSNLTETLRTLRDVLTDLFSKSLSSTPGTTDKKMLQNLKSGFSHIPEAARELLCEVIEKLSTDLASKAPPSAPGVAELLDILAKLGLSTSDQLLDSQSKVQPSTQNIVPESNTVATETKDLGKSKVGTTLKVPDSARSEKQTLRSSESNTKPQPEPTTENNVKHGNIKKAKLPDTALESAVGSKTAVAGKKEKVKKINECYSSEKSHMMTSQLPPVGNNESYVGRIYDYRDKMKELGAVLYEPCEIADISASDHVKGDALDGGNTFISSARSKNAIGAFGTGTSNFPSSVSGPSFMYECPFSGTTMENTSAASPGVASQDSPLRKSSSQNDDSAIVFHRGVRCDGCGVHPIFGPRFKSKVRVDYDLCGICFSRMGNETDYMRMDQPAFYRPPFPFKGLYGFKGVPSLPQVGRGFKVKMGSFKLDSRFIQDINIIDGTVLAPLTPFTKIWRMRNNGTAVWPQRTQLRWIGGDKLSSVLSVEVEIPAAGLPVDQELDVAVDFIAPELPGRYISYWRMTSPSGQKFGQRVWVLIQVDASLKETQHEGVRGFNLNLPPVSTGLTGPEIISVDPEPIVEISHPKHDSSKKIAQPVNEVVDLKPNFEHDLKFPINDSLLVGGGGASSSVPSAAPSVSYPIIDLTPMAPAFSFVGPDMINPPPPPPPSIISNSQASRVELPEIPLPVPETENILLKELEEMGFKQVDLNKDVLRMNKYNLEETVNVLCGGAEWDPILEELREMGFHDTEMNQKLLQKNHGSIKRVVMDLVAGEDV